MKKAMTVSILALIMFLSIGCATEPMPVGESIAQAKSALGNARRVIDQAGVEKQRIDAMIASTPAGDRRDHLTAVRDQIERNETQLRRFVGHLQGAANAVGALDDTHTVGDGARVIAPLLPPPWNYYVALGAPLVGSVAGGIVLFFKKKKAEQRLAQTQAAAAGVVRAIEASKDDKGVIDFNDKDKKTELRSRMAAVPGAIALVEQARAA